MITLGVEKFTTFRVCRGSDKTLCVSISSASSIPLQINAIGIEMIDRAESITDKAPVRMTKGVIASTGKLYNNA
jgi:hypothetical protein